MAPLPPFLAAVAAALAGLIAGAGGVAVQGLGVALAAAVLRPLRGLAFVATAGIVWGVLAAREAEGCRRAAAARTRWTGTLGLSRAAPGEAATADVEVGSCAVPATLAVASGTAAPGGRVLVAGDALPTPRGILVRAAAVVPAGDGSWRMAARARAAAALDTLFGARAPLARALLVADTRDLSNDLKDRFADSGLIHALSISGLHVAIVAEALTLLFGLLRAPPATASAAGLAATGAYVALLGAPPPAVRAGVMLAVPVVAQLAQRPLSPWAAVAWGALLPLLLDPLAALDVGYQLSVGGMAALIAAGALARRVVGDRWPGWRGRLARELVAGTVVAALSAPLSAWYTGRLSLVAPVTNLAANPVLALLQPALFVTLACVPVRPLAELAAAGALPLLAAFDGIATAGAAPTWAAVGANPGALAAAATGVAVVGAGVACLEPRLAMRGLGVSAAALALVVWQPVVAPARHTELHVFDVGQGDALGIRTRRGRWVLVDAGPAGRRSDAGRSVVAPALRRRGGTVEALVLTHADLDHVGGAASLIRFTTPRRFWDPALPGTGDAYRDALRAAARHGVAWQAARAGDSLVVDEVVLRVLAPDGGTAERAEGPNDASVVLLAEVGAVRWLLTGDAEAAEEAWLAARWGDALRADVLKVGHHGSRTSTTETLRELVRPRVALVSVGRDNRYGHPAPDVLGRLAAGGALVLRTDRLGTLVVRTDGRSLEVEAAGERVSLGAR